MPSEQRLLARAWNRVELAKLGDARPRVHPNGFVQLDLGDGMRLHVWPEDPHHFVPVAPHPVHDHVFDMESTVVRGCLIQTVYAPRLEHGGKPSHEVLTANYHSATDSSLVRSGCGVSLGPVSQLEVHPGETYRQPAFTFHETRQQGLTVTLMQQRDIKPGTCRVLLPLGAEPLARFDRHAWPESELWDFIAAALEYAPRPITCSNQGP